MKIFGRYEAASSQAAISLAGGGWLVVAGGWWWCRLLMRARVIIGRRVGRRGGACALAPALSCVNCCRAGAGQQPGGPVLTSQPMRTPRTRSGDTRPSAATPAILKRELVPSVFN